MQRKKRVSSDLEGNNFDIKNIEQANKSRNETTLTYFNIK